MKNLAKGEKLISKGQMITAALIGQLAASEPPNYRFRAGSVLRFYQLEDEVVAAGNSTLADEILTQIGPC